MRVEIDNNLPGPDYIRISANDAYGLEQILAKVNVAALRKLRDDALEGRGGIPDDIENPGCWSQYTFDFMHDNVEQHARARAVWVEMIERMIEGFEFILKRGIMIYAMQASDYQAWEQRAQRGRALYAQYFWHLYV